MELGLDGKSVVVTGGSRGIGRAVATAFVDEGARVLICARQAEPLAAAVAELAARSRHTDGVRGVPADVTDQGVPEQIAGVARRAFGGVDVLVNNVGGSMGGSFDESSEGDWRRGLELNALSAVRMSQAVVPLMQEVGGGAIVHIASIWGREAGGKGPYNMGKAAMISLSKSMARDLAPHNIRVNAVAPGSTRFPGGSWDRRVQADPEGMQRFVAEQLPFGRFGRAEEIAAAVVFLASNAASWVAGACLPVDGCQSHSIS